LSDDKLETKVNSVNMDDFCLKNNIKLLKTNDWKVFGEFCKKENVDMIITLGDSRIVPKIIVNNFEVIGNHGAILPKVQGGASLVWGRMLANGTWGSSIMRLGEKIDSGEILKTRTFEYDRNTTEDEFVKISDNTAVDLLIEVLQGKSEPQENKKWDIRLSKHVDSYKAKEILEYCLKNDMVIYLPPRNPDDSIVKKHWPDSFKKNFKIANNFPYPKWREEQ